MRAYASLDTPEEAIVSVNPEKCIAGKGTYFLQHHKMDMFTLFLTNKTKIALDNSNVPIFLILCSICFFWKPNAEDAGQDKKEKGDRTDVS